MLALIRPIWLLAAFALAGQSESPLEAGMVIERSVTIRPGTYRLSSPADPTRPALTIRGDNITVDFNGAVLTGGPEAADPDVYTGIGVLIEGGRNITVKNAVIRGYKIGILARRSPDLHLTSNDLSYNWKPRLHSGVEKESLVDSMSYHQNEKDEWLPHGAGGLPGRLRSGRSRSQHDCPGPERPHDRPLNEFAELRFDIQRK